MGVEAVVIRDHVQGPRGVGSAEYLDRGGGHMSLCMWLNFKYAHEHK